MNSRTARFLVAAACATVCTTAVPALASSGSARPIPLAEYQYYGHSAGLLATVAKSGRRVYLSYACSMDNDATAHPVAIRNGRFVVHMRRFIGRQTDKITGRFISGRRIRFTSALCGDHTAKFTGVNPTETGS